MERAKRNLERFDLVGFLERQDDMLDRFQQRFGVRLRLPHKNASPKSRKEQSSILTEPAMERIRQICQPNQEIYDFALERFTGRSQD